ncbi:hypothetical protein N9L18_00995 [Candidatus Pacebacteria bacterium]|nr:hypothetical protein [Candidatus Paceibacterota bacterium]
MSLREMSEENIHKSIIRTRWIIELPSSSLRILVVEMIKRSRKPTWSPAIRTIKEAFMILVTNNSNFDIASITGFGFRFG